MVAPAFAGRPEVPESWAVTSDSLAVLAAGAIGADEAILLKPVAGVMARWPSDDPPLPRLTADELQALQDAGGGRAVDPYLPEAVRRTGVAVVVREPAASAPGRHADRPWLSRPAGAQLGHRRRHQLGAQLGCPVAAATHGRAHADDVGVHAAQLAQPQLPGDAEDARRPGACARSGRPARTPTASRTGRGRP